MIYLRYIYYIFGQMITSIIKIFHLHKLFLEKSQKDQNQASRFLLMGHPNARCCAEKTAVEVEKESQQTEVC